MLCWIYEKCYFFKDEPSNLVMKITIVKLIKLIEPKREKCIEASDKDCYYFVFKFFLWFPIIVLYSNAIYVH